MTKVKLLLLILAMASFVGGCGSRKISDLSSDSINYAAANPYKVGVGDQLDVRVWRNEELSVQVPVRPDGKISTPLVGDILAAGKEVPQLEQEIESKLAAYVRSPEVTVIVINANNAEFVNRVRVTGAVITPISAPYSQGMTVLDLILLAGGLNEFANANNAKLYRTTPTGVEVHNVYLDDILKKGDLRSNYTLRPSDIVAVPEKIL